MTNYENMFNLVSREFSAELQEMASLCVCVCVFRFGSFFFFLWEKKKKNEDHFISNGPKRKFKRGTRTLARIRRQCCDLKAIIL